MKNPNGKPVSVDISRYGNNTVHYEIISILEKKHPNHDFAVFGSRLFVDDKDIPFNYSDQHKTQVGTIVEKIEKDLQLS